MTIAMTVGIDKQSPRKNLPSLKRWMTCRHCRSSYFKKVPCNDRTSPFWILENSKYLLAAVDQSRSIGVYRLESFDQSRLIKICWSKSLDWKSFDRNRLIEACRSEFAVRTTKANHSIRISRLADRLFQLIMIVQWSFSRSSVDRITIVKR